MFWENDGAKMYEGSWCQGQRNGFGTSYFDAIKEYQGEWSNDEKNGVGNEYNDDGTLEFHGTWKDNQPMKK